MDETGLLARITTDADQCGGRPCIRGMRIRVIDVLELLAAGETPERIQRTYKGKIALDRGAGEVKPAGDRSGSPRREEEIEPLSLIIQELNERFGADLGPRTGSPCSGSRTSSTRTSR